MKKIYKSLLGITLCTGMASVTNAQVSAYAFSQSASTYSAVTGGSVIVVATANTAAGSMDDAVYNLPAGSFPFTFTFNGVGYTGCNISSNGFITFGATAPTSTNYTPISGTALFAGSISAWGGDINSMFSIGTSSVTGEIRYEVVGSSPNREVVIQYSNWRPSYSTGTTNVYALNYQIRLQETTNIVSIVYGSNAYVVGSTNITSTRQIGLRGAANADYNNRLNAAGLSFTASTAGSANSSAQTFSTTGTTPGMPIDGLTYIWTPPTPCSGTPNAGTATASQTTICTPSNVNFNLTGSTGGVTGLTYLWYSSPNGSSWTAIPTATTMATTQSVTASTYYQCEVSCGASTATSTPIQVTIAPTTTNTVPYFEGFEGITSTNQLPNCSWMISNPTICQTYTASGTNNRIPRTGTKFGSFRYGTNTAGDYFYTNGIQLTAGVNYIASAYYVTDGANGWSEFSLLYGTSQSTTALTGIASTTGTLTNTAYNNLAGTFSVSATGTYYIALKAIGNGTPWYLSIDDISVIAAPTCTAAPVAGTITGPTTINSGTPYSYTLSPSTGDIQWYTAPALTGPWSAVAGATTTPSDITASGSGTLYIGAIASTPGCVNDTTDFPLAVNVIFAGDNVCDAIPLSIGTSAPYKPAGASIQTGEVVPPGTGCTTNNSWCNATLNNSMWFSFVAPTSGYVSVQTPGFDTQLAIWKAASCNDLLSTSTATLMAANDDDPNYSANSGVQYSSYCKAACLTPGMTYYIQLDSYSAAVPTESTTIIITDLGVLDASFTGLASNYCLPASSSSLTPATVGGVFTINTSTTTVTSFDPAIAGLGTHTVNYSIFGCQSMSTTIVANTPTVGAVASSTLICSGETATLTANGAINYTWSPVGGTSAMAMVSPTANATYTVVGEDNGCSSTATVSVDVNAAPSVSASASNTLVCSNFNESSILTASTSATSYTWSTGENTAVITVTPAVGTTYTLTVNDGLCDAMTTVFVDAQVCMGVKESLASNAFDIFPNPNTGSVNITITTELKGNIALQVYDAIGKLVMTENLTNEANIINTSKLEAGVYIYKIINNNKEVKVGKMIKH